MGRGRRDGSGATTPGWPVARTAAHPGLRDHDRRESARARRLADALRRCPPPREGEGLLAAGYLRHGPPAPWWDVELQVVRAQPFFRYVVHDALAAAGHASRIAGACRDWEALLARCPTTLGETWYGGTTCHGWSATPTRDLILYTLGISPACPGFTRARVAPRPGDLAWVRGAAPTPYGLLHLAVEPDHVEIETPVPVTLDLEHAAPRELAAGHHRIACTPGASSTQA